MVTVEKLHDKVEHLTENCIPHIQQDIAELKTDVSWLKKNQWLLLTTAITTLIGVVFLLFKM